MSRRGDLGVGAAFLALGLVLVVTGMGFPPGMAGLPGPGFFPVTIGAVVCLLSGALLWQARRTPAGGTAAAPLHDKGRLAVAVALLAGYLLLWGVVPFPLRTFVFLLAFLRLAQERWRSAAAVSAVLTAAVVAAFQFGLRVSLE